MNRNEREDHIRSFVVPKHRKFLFEVNGLRFEKLDDAQWHAYCRALRKPNEPMPRIYCRLARHTEGDTNG